MQGQPDYYENTDMSNASCPYIGAITVILPVWNKASHWLLRPWRHALFWFGGQLFGLVVYLIRKGPKPVIFLFKRYISKFFHFNTIRLYLGAMIHSFKSQVMTLLIKKAIRRRKNYKQELQEVWKFLIMIFWIISARNFEIRSFLNSE